MPINKIKTAFQDPHKSELLKGSAESIITKVVSMIIGYSFIMILSRNYGAEAVGIYQIALQFMSIIVAIALFGFNQSIIRFTAELVSKSHIKELISIQRRFSIISFAIATIFAIVVFVYSKQIATTFLKDESLDIVFQSLSFVLPVITLNNLYVETIRGLKKIKISEFFRFFSVRFFNLIGFLIAIWFMEFNNLLPIITFEIATFLSFLLVFYFARKYLREKLVNNIDNKESMNRKYISTSFIMYQSIILMMISNEALVFILAYYTDPAEVGIYNIAFLIANLTVFVFGAVTTITAPKYSELYNGNKEIFQKTVRFSTKMIFWSAGIISVVTIIFSDLLMGIFGTEFLAGSLILIILSLGNFINAFTGSSGLLLDMVGKHHIRRNILIFNTVITLILSFSLVPSYGALGLAYSSLANMIIGNFIGAYYVYKNLGVNMIYLPLITKG